MQAAPGSPHAPPLALTVSCGEAQLVNGCVGEAAAGDVGGAAQVAATIVVEADEAALGVEVARGAALVVCQATVGFIKTGVAHLTHVGGGEAARHARGHG